MNGRALWIFLIVFIMLFFVGWVSASITFDVDGRWETSYDCADWNTYGDPLDCDGLSKCGGWTCSGLYEQITSAANNPNGTGGKGQRHWVGDGTNSNSGGIAVEFSHPQKELWVRWYMRYEDGFSWDPLQYDKILYFHSGSTSLIPEFVWGDQFALIAQSTSDYYQARCYDCGWPRVYPSNISDGCWHFFEIHVGMDTNQLDGVAQFWLDGVLLINESDVDWSDGNLSSMEGWTNFGIGSNQNSPDNGRCMAVDFDDVVVYNQTPPNLDAFGNAFIGPVNNNGQYHVADLNDDGVINMKELISYIARWKANNGVSRAEVEEARDIWFNGGVY